MVNASGINLAKKNHNSISPANSVEEKRRQFDQIYSEYASIISSRVNKNFSDKEVCREVMQEIWTSFYVALHQRTIESYSAYLGKIAENKIADMIKKLQKDRKRFIFVSNYTMFETEKLNNDTINSEDIWKIYDAEMMKLPPDLELAWRLRMDATDLKHISRLSSLSLDELTELLTCGKDDNHFRAEKAAQVMGLSVDQYERRFKKAREILKRSLGVKLKNFLNIL